MTGQYCKHIEQLHGILEEIKYFETLRLEEEPLNKSKLNPLYCLYFNLLEVIEDEKGN